MLANGSPAPDLDPGSAEVREALRSRGQRWTPQRRLILEVLAETRGHISGRDLIDLCRRRDPDTTPSTVYRTLDVLEELGFISHSHAADGHEEFHVMPAAEHAHLQCRRCGRTWELSADDSDAIAAPARDRFGFRADIGHMTLVGVCAECLAATESAA